MRQNNLKNVSAQGGLIGKIGSPRLFFLPACVGFWGWRIYPLTNGAGYRIIGVEVIRYDR